MEWAATVGCAERAGRAWLLDADDQAGSANPTAVELGVLDDPHSAHPVVRSGSVEVESTVGAGSRFTLRLPARPPETSGRSRRASRSN